MTRLTCKNVPLCTDTLWQGLVVKVPCFICTLLHMTRFICKGAPSYMDTFYMARLICESVFYIYIFHILRLICKSVLFYMDIFSYDAAYLLRCILYGHFYIWHGSFVKVSYFIWRFFFILCGSFEKVSCFIWTLFHMVRLICKGVLFYMDTFS